MTKTAAIVGASAHRRKFGNKAVRCFREAGYQVFPINPNEREIEGLPAFRSISEIPVAKIDVVSVYLPAPHGLPFLSELSGVSLGELILNPGADPPEVIAKARELGLPLVIACSIRRLGFSPDQFGDD